MNRHVEIHFEKTKIKFPPHNSINFNKYYLDAEKAKKFKRRAVGFFRKSSVKTLEEISEILVEVGMAANKSDAGRIFINSLVGERICYCPDLKKYIHFYRIESENPQLNYRITVHYD